MKVVLAGPDDKTWIIDTPQPEIVGIWLKAIFDTYKIADGLAMRFKVEVS